MKPEMSHEEFDDQVTIPFKRCKVNGDIPVCSAIEWDKGKRTFLSECRFLGYNECEGFTCELEQIGLDQQEVKGENPWEYEYLPAPKWCPVWEKVKP